MDGYPTGGGLGPDPVVAGVGTGPEAAPGTSGESQASGPTGHPLVDAALAQLDRVAGQPAAEQVAAYEETHRVLQQTLATIDQT
ncbi:hypothetical protein Raf01_74200 [Rugosimonospora africana]|uniref:Uncharacterized protein n=2 Tax=Rugosimonospora africana TaxID=556532 RepID=A0A8J3QYJ9_9ACTN|nr:hypothetical protein Raf01_74200 [Rugosimonospora africana]